MSIRFNCDSCGNPLKAGEELVGKKAKCRKCGAVVTVPSSAAEEPLAPVSVVPDQPAPPRVQPPPAAPRPAAPAGPAGATTLECGGCGRTVKVKPDQPGGARCMYCGAVIEVRSPAMDVPPIPVAPPMGGAAPVGHPFPVSPTAAPPLPADGSPPMAEILPATRPGGEPVGVRELATINTMVESGRYLEATQALRSIEHEAQGHPGFHYLCGLAYAGLGNYPHALDHLSRAISGGVQSPAAYAAKGKAELELAQFVPAIESLDAALDLAGTDIPDYMADLARAYDGAKMPRDAAATWNALAQISPNHPALLERKRAKEEGRARRHDHQVQEAMVQMQKEQRASDTACWICIILRCLLECM